MQARREQREELAAFQLIELHSIPASQGPDWQDIELARISQKVAERFYNVVAVGEAADVRVGSRTVKLTASIYSPDYPR